jgi:ATP-dependent exoDNAse (exonuclease V) beta subunit
VYGDNVKEASHALSLGSEFHDVMADEIVSRNTDVDKLIARLDDEGGHDPELYSWVPNIVDFNKRWSSLCAKGSLEATIEQKYAMTRDCKKTGFMSKDAYIRGVFDLWALDEANKKLIVIDHKSSKSAISANAVKEHTQLNLYVYMLTRMFNLDWERAHIALHFVRHNKIVWAGVNQKEMEAFGKRYLHLLSILEDRTVKAYETGNWERTKGVHCRWCSFKGECP